MSALVKATHAQLGLRAHDVLGVAGGLVAVRAKGAITAINEAPRGGWLPIEVELAVIEAIAAEAGLAGVRQRVCRQVMLSADGPLLKPIRDGAARVFGLSPANLLRFGSPGWRSSFEGCGDLRWTAVDERSGTLTYHGRPPLLAASRAWSECIAGAVLGVYGVCQVEGTADLTIGTSDVACHCRW